MESHDAVIVRVDATFDKPGFGRAVDEPDSTVMAKQQFVGDLADGRIAG
jgi:hypothetical protein